MTSRKTHTTGGTPAATTSTAPTTKDPQGSDAATTGAQKPQRLDQRLKSKLKALRGRKKDKEVPDPNESQKRNSLSKRKKNICSTDTRTDNRTITTDNRTRDEVTVTTDDAIPFGTPAWKTKRIEELGKGDVIFGKRRACRIADLICIEDHGRVFKAFSTKQIEGTPIPKRDKEDAFPLAVKTDMATGSMKKWFNTEKDVLLAISNLRPSSISEHFPQIFDSGELYFFRYIIMSLHGPNLERLRKDILRADFSTSTAVRIGFQCLTTIADLHLIGYHHRDLKPTNFVIGMDTGADYYLRNTNLRTVYMVGFGTCTKKKEVHEKTERRFINLTFGSRKSHNLSHVLDKNDDLESWLFLAVELFKRGALPWRRKASRPDVAVMKQKFFDEVGFPGIYDFVPEQFKFIIQKGFVDIPEGKSINISAVRDAFRDICHRYRITEATPFDWEPGANNRFNYPKAKAETVIVDDAPIRGELGDGLGIAKKLVPVKIVTPSPAATGKNTTGTTTTTEDDEDEKEKQQESTNLDESASVMLRRVVFDKNNTDNTTEEHSCPSLDPTLSQTIIKNAIDREAQNRSTVPRGIPPDDPLLKLTLNKTRKNTLLGSGGNGKAVKKPSTNRMKNAMFNNNKKKERSEDRDTTKSTTEEK